MFKVIIFCRILVLGGSSRYISHTSCSQINSIKPMQRPISEFPKARFRSHNQTTKQPVSQAGRQANNPPSKQSTKQTIRQSNNQASKQTSKPTINQATKQPGNHYKQPSVQATKQTQNPKSVKHFQSHISKTTSRVRSTFFPNPINHAAHTQHDSPDTSTSGYSQTTFRCTRDGRSDCSTDNTPSPQRRVARCRCCIALGLRRRGPGSSGRAGGWTGGCWLGRCCERGRSGSS
jgi:hypothetical protein